MMGITVFTLLTVWSEWLSIGCLVGLCYVGPCHCGMVQPLVVDGGDGLQVWRVAVNVLNKQSWTVDKGWPSSLRVEWGAETHHKWNVPQGLRIWQILWNDLGNRKWYKIWTWNVRSLSRAGLLKTVASELEKYNLDLVAVQEVRWCEGGSQPTDNFICVILLWMCRHQLRIKVMIRGIASARN